MHLYQRALLVAFPGSFRFIISAFDIAAISADGLYAFYCIFSLTDKSSDYAPVPIAP
jgi:hypothetical protein